MDDRRHRLDELETKGYCVVRQLFERSLVESCRKAVWSTLLAHIASREPNRGAHRHFLPMPFDPPCFAQEFFFDETIMDIARSTLGDRVVADQWGCDVALEGSTFQGVHADYARPLFGEMPDLALPPYMLLVSFGLSRIISESGPIEIAPATHRMARGKAMHAVESGEISLRPVELEIGDVLIRHPWALHRGSPNTTTNPRALVSIRYVRHWYADGSRDVAAMPRAVWEALTVEQHRVLRFPIAGVTAARTHPS